MFVWNKICDIFAENNHNQNSEKMNIPQNPLMEKMLYLIDSNHFALKVDTNPSRDKIERIKQSISRKQQLFERTIEHYKKEKAL